MLSISLILSDNTEILMPVSQKCQNSQFSLEIRANLMYNKYCICLAGAAISDDRMMDHPDHFASVPMAEDSINFSGEEAVYE